MKKATKPLARHARSHGRSRHHHRRHHEDFDDALGATTECSMTPKKERGLYGALGGAAVGLAAATAGFFIVTTKNRALQAAAGAPSPKPGLAAGLAAAGAMTVGAIGGRLWARKKPTC